MYRTFGDYLYSKSRDVDLRIASCDSGPEVLKARIFVDGAVTDKTLDWRIQVTLLRGRALVRRRFVRGYRADLAGHSLRMV